jgi:hypothetical protein
VWIVNLVHDEVLLDCPADLETLTWAKKVAIDALDSVPPDFGLTRVPFKCEAEIGRRWSIYQKPEKGVKNG